MNKTTKIVLAIAGLCLLCFILFLVVTMFCLGHTKQYVTNNVLDYGKYIGNYDNNSVQTFIDSFFPDKIEDTFSDIVYSYRAQKNDAYAFEAYLSFTISDTEQYHAFVERCTKGLASSEFRYDDTYWEYTLADEFVPTFLPNTEQNESEDIHIRYAKIGKILCSLENQEIIFVALGVYDGGIVKTDFLSVYFDHFHIDPREYAIHSVPAYMN